ncbi:hypothetical protein BN1723_008319 [Verticillium longisporum]|uniref:Uncharacterized protein n=1 Tax=Verticillium longisporum TaxID=100787 RepID=A0A0G4NRG6_VERLO|nr:hypothetical protein BN1708_012317 [Verticillium longisporum]CRK48999.1 hypothetical protein BN1723_008319 [Verticillium longisporum]
MGTAVSYCSYFVQDAPVILGEPILLMQLEQVHDRAKLSHDMLAGENARNKCLRDWETLTKAIHAMRESSFRMAMDERTQDSNTEISCALVRATSLLWAPPFVLSGCRVHLQSTKDWPEIFNGLTVKSILSDRPLNLSLPKPYLELHQAIRAAFPDMNMDEYRDHLETLRVFELNDNVLKRLPQKSMKLFMHCEVLPHIFLSGIGTQATLPALSLLIQRHRQLFPSAAVPYECLPKVAPANLYEGQVSDAVKLREELLDEIIEKMQHDTLSTFKQKFPQGKRNDSRTDLRIMESVSSDLVDVGCMHARGRNPGRFSAGSTGYGRPNDHGDYWKNVK